MKACTYYFDPKDGKKPNTCDAHGHKTICAICRQCPEHCPGHLGVRPDLQTTINVKDLQK